MQKLKKDYLTWLCMLLIFALNIPHTAAISNILSGVLFIGICMGFANRTLVINIDSPPIKWFYILFLWCLIASLISPYMIESLSALRKEFFSAVLIYLALTCKKASLEEKRQSSEMIVLTLLASFLTRTILAFWNCERLDFQCSIYQLGSLPRYLDFYAIDSAMYLPILVAWIIYANPVKSLRMSAVFLLIVSIYLVLIAGVRTAPIAIALSIGLILIVKFYKKIIFWSLIVGAVLSASLYLSLNNGPAIERYKSIISSKSYGEDRMSGRTTLWYSMLEIIKEKPVQGYGVGWKKLPVVANDLGLVEKWKNDENENIKGIAEYYQMGIGKVNPHNLVLGIIFEIGMVGLFIYFMYLFVNIKLCAGLFVHKNWVGVAASGVLVSYFVLGLTNSIWLPNVLVTLFLAAGLNYPIKIKKS